MNKLYIITAVIFSAVLLSGCVTPAATGGVLQMKITDAPAGEITSLNVTISQIEIHKGDVETPNITMSGCAAQCQALGYGTGECREGATGETICLDNEVEAGNVTTECNYTGNETNMTSVCCCDTTTASSDFGTGWITFSSDIQTFDLILIKDVNDILGEKTLEPGKYTQIRLKVDSAKAVIDGKEYDLEVPSGKLKLIHPFTVEDNKTTSLILDFDAEKSVVKAGNSGNYNLKPTIKVTTEFTGKKKGEAEQIKNTQMIQMEEKKAERQSQRGEEFLTETYDVEITDGVFIPDTLTIEKGDTVRWTNNDYSIHALISTGKFESPGLREGESWEHTFDSKGTYNYFCSEHLNENGKIIVE